MNIEKEMREKCINELNNLIEDPEISKQIEESIYNYSRKYYKFNNDKLRKLYCDKIVSLYANIDPNSTVGNIKLLEKIKTGDIDLQRIAFMAPQELFKEHWEKLVEQKQCNDKFLYTKKQGIISDLYKCGRCKKKAVSYYELQTRGGDEPMTTFFTCTNCGHKWKS